MRYRVYVEQTQYLEAEIEADSIEDARAIATQGYGVDWQDATGGLGLGDDDTKVLDIEEVDETDDDDNKEQM